MNLSDLLKRVTEDDRDKMFIFREDEGWSNVNFKVNEHEITITLDDNEIFTDDKTESENDMNERNPYFIGNGRYIVYYSNPLYKDFIKKFTGICENFNSGGLSAFWNEEKQQMLLVSFRDIVGLHPIK